MQLKSPPGGFRLGIAGVLAALGLAGALTDQFAWEGGWVTWVGGAIFVGGAVLVFWDQVVTPARERRAEVWARQSSLRAVVETDPAPIRDINPYEIGVFPSDLAAEVSDGKSPYVPRDLDHRGLMDAAFDEAALRQTERLVVVRGEPKAGKSRTLWEALQRNCGDRHLVALRAPLIGEPAQPEAKPLESFLRVGLRHPDEGLVLLIDDAHEHLEHGLTRSALRRAVEQYPTIVIAMTLHNHQLEKIKQFDRPLERLLRTASGGLVLEPQLTREELERAQALYPMLKDDDELGWLPETFAAVNILRDRFRDSGSLQPVGVALVKAAIDWRRAGMPPAIPRDDLRALAEIVRDDTAGDRSISDEAFETGLEWATKEVRARASLLRPVGKHEAESYQAFDALVSSTMAEGRPVSDACWEFVLNRVQPTTGVAVGASAFVAERQDVAEQAWKSVSRSDDEAAAVALLSLGYLYGNPVYGNPVYGSPVYGNPVYGGPVYEAQDRHDDELEVYDELVARFGDDASPALREQVAMALFNKGATLGLLDRHQEEIGVYDELVARFGDDASLALREQVAMALFNKGATFGLLDRHEEAIDAFEELVARFGDDPSPALREPLARALVGKGVALGLLDRHQEEIGVYDEVVARFGDDPSPALRDLVETASRYRDELR